MYRTHPSLLQPSTHTLATQLPSGVQHGRRREGSFLDASTGRHEFCMAWTGVVDDQLRVAGDTVRYQITAHGSCQCVLQSVKQLDRYQHSGWLHLHSRFGDRHVCSAHITDRSASNVDDSWTDGGVAHPAVHKRILAVLFKGRERFYTREVGTAP